jgi:hypothetical protein
VKRPARPLYRITLIGSGRILLFLPFPPNDYIFSKTEHYTVIILRTWQACAVVVESIMRPSDSCDGAPRYECSFNGAWRGPGLKPTQDLYVSSYFFDRAIDSQIVPDTKAWSASVRPIDFLMKVRKK